MFTVNNILISWNTLNDKNVKWSDIETYFDPNGSLGLMPNDEDQKAALHHIKKAIKKLHTTDDGSMLKHAISGFLRVQSDVQRRRVGKVLSYSKPGQGVDILLGTS